MPDLVNSGSITLVDGTGGVNPPAGSFLDIGVEDHPAVSLDLEGAFTATLVIEAIAEAGPAGADWFTPVALNASLTVATATLSAAGRRFVSGAGLARVRVRCTAFTSGPITATLRAGQGLVEAATLNVQGTAAAGAVPAGNPILNGGVDPAGGTTVNSLQVQSAATPNLRTSLYSGVNLIGAGIQGSSDAAATTFAALQVATYGGSYNGTTWDRVRNNVTTNQFNGTNTTVGATNHTPQTNYNNAGAILTLNITAASGTTPTLDVKVQIADGAGTFFDLTDSAGNAVAFAQKTTTGSDTLKICPGIVEKLTTTGKQYNGQLPRSYRLVSTLGGTTPSFTYRLDVSELK
jgi:hypothetical protein